MAATVVNQQPVRRLAPPKRLRLMPPVALIFFSASGGAYGIESLFSTSGPGKFFGFRQGVLPGASPSPKSSHCGSGSPSCRAPTGSPAAGRPGSSTRRAAPRRSATAW